MLKMTNVKVFTVISTLKPLILSSGISFEEPHDLKIFEQTGLV